MATKKNIEKDFAYYLNLPWTFIVEQAADKGGKKIYIISVNELPGVVTDAPTLKKAFESIQEAMLLSFEMYQDAGEPIPVPVNEDDFKGNIAYRTTTQRHFEIAKEAKKRKISLSQMIDHYIDNGRSSKK